MTTCVDLISRAYRLAGGLRDSSQPVDSADAKVGLDELQSLILTLPGAQWWTDVELTDDYMPGENERLFNTTDATVTITLPTTLSTAKTMLFECDRIRLICDCSTDRIPKDGSRVQIAGGATYRYCADVGDWLRADSLTLTSSVPLNADMHMYLAALLAIPLAQSEGAELPATTTALAQAGLTTMRARFGKRQEVAVDSVLRRVGRHHHGFSTNH